ncbi:uncharacterized protein LOC124440708 [Xenia sp. Carnegie-2017]|uniref:uncharacterized protein LOC124440708 n=1 Tax=Xenia sp. Carnegie-2017 TaxID=2897299 RepID=UPI001F039A58|nr:uncharacterized protein LOC124440708 [Xenia sp. Carnegie-2017]
MGIWSYISSCNLATKRKKEGLFTVRKSKEKQIVNIDSDIFRSTLLEDVKEIRIQENYDDTEKNESYLISDENTKGNNYPIYFEYSMGGNLQCYKEHLKKNFVLENKSRCAKDSEIQRSRKTSHSDYDSEPESLRYARKPQENMPHAVNAITEEPELLFDYYSSIYQPEFMLNINSDSFCDDLPLTLEPDNSGEEHTTIKKKDERQEERQECFMDIKTPSSLENKDCVFMYTVEEFCPMGAQLTEQQNISSPVDYKVSLCHNVDEQEEDTKRQKVEFLHDKNRQRQKTKSSLETCLNPYKVKDLRIPNVRWQNEKNQLFKTETTADDCDKTIQQNVNKEDYLQQNKIDRTSPLLQEADRKKMTKAGVIHNEQKDELSTEVLSEQIIKEISDLSESIIHEENNIALNDFVSFDEELSSKRNGSCSERPIKEMEAALSSKRNGISSEQPISEISFLETTHRARHNSLEIFEMLERQCMNEEKKTIVECKSPTEMINIHQTYQKLPKEFQEIARRLSNGNSTKNSSIHQSRNDESDDGSSPRSPSGRPLFRTPSYRMPKTPSLSRHHPSTYVSQHTSPRSRSSSRMSSRTSSPTRN